MTLISVVMSVYNGEKYLETAIASILSQTVSDFEFIIIDDGSKDGTREILSRHSARDGRLKVISCENRGIAISLNDGLSVAQGSLIARMDADDIALPERFARQVAYLEAHPDCGLIGGQILYTDPDNRPLMTSTHPANHEAVMATMMGGSASLAHPTVMFRRAVALEIGGYSNDFLHAEDVDFFLRFGERARLANLPDCVLRYRQHWKSVGFENGQVQADSKFRAIREAAMRVGAPEPLPVEIGSFGTLETIYERWAWWALGDRHLDTARFYARKVLWKRPLDSASWRLFACAFRGY